jgi:hypothetical protein
VHEDHFTDADRVSDGNDGIPMVASPPSLARGRFNSSIWNVENGIFSMLLGVGMYAAITVFRANWDKFWLHVWASVYSSGIALVLVVLAALVFLFCAAYVIAKGIKKGWS